MDEARPARSARRAAADDDLPTTVLPPISGRAGARRSLTPDWDDEPDEGDGTDAGDGTDKGDGADAGAASDSPAPPEPAAGPQTARWRPVGRPAPGDEHAPFRPPADDADTVVIKRGDLSAALIEATGSPAATPALQSGTPSWHPTNQRGTPPVTDTETGTDAPAEELASAPSSPGTQASGADVPPAAPAPLGPRGRWLVLIAVVAVFAVLVGIAVTWLGRGAKQPGASASVSTAGSSAAAALTESDLAGVADATLAVPAAWTLGKTTSPVTDSLAPPLCLAPVAGMPVPAASYQRDLTAPPAAMVHRADAYATVAEATSATATRSAQLGRCATVPVLLSSGAVVTGLGDEAVAVTAVIQDPTPTYHTVVLVRTGTVVDVIDVSQPGTPIAIEKAVGTAAAVAGRQCDRSGGACVTSPKIAVGPPPSGGAAGWLTVSDLPRITPGFGRWTAGEPTTTIRIISSQCENTSFATAPGPAQRRQRTYLLTEDAVPKGFGLDQLLLDFDTPDAAAGFAKSVIDNIESCQTRVPTAQLGATGTFTGTGVAGEPISGYWRTITQPTSAATAATFRVAVATVGKRVVYLLLTPSGAYDLSNDAWAAVGLRAAQRATQQG